LLRNPDHAYFGVVCNRLGYDIFYLCTKFDDSSFSHSEVSLRAQKFKMGHVTSTMPLLRVICPPYMLGLNIIACCCAKFDQSSFSRSRDMVARLQNLNDSLDLTTPLSWMIFHPQARTCYCQPAYQIWSRSPPII